MTQEEKELLLKDLCARLPYQPICEFTDTEDDFCTATASPGYSLRDFIARKVRRFFRWMRKFIRLS